MGREGERKTEGKKAEREGEEERWGKREGGRKGKREGGRERGRKEGKEGGRERGGGKKREGRGAKEGEGRGEGGVREIVCYQVHVDSQRTTTSLWEKLCYQG